MPGFFIMMSMSRCNPSQVQGNSDENWWRNTPFSTIAFIFNSRKKVLQYGWFFCHSDRYNKNILMTETATGYPSVIPCWVWVLDVVFFLSYFQSLALGSEQSKIWNPIHSTIKNQNNELLYTNCYWIPPYFLVFKTSHISFDMLQ